MTRAKAADPAPQPAIPLSEANLRIARLSRQPVETCLILIMPSWMNMFAASRLLVSGYAYQQEGDVARAKHMYQEAVSLDGSLADAYLALSKLSWTEYLKTHSPVALAESSVYLREASLRNKDPRYRDAQTGQSSHFSVYPQ